VIGLLGRIFIGVGDELYALTPYRDSVKRYTGNGYAWTIVGSSADWIYSGPETLYMTEPGTKDILLHNGQVWERLRQPSRPSNLLLLRGRLAADGQSWRRVARSPRVSLT
jgi:hypothetical protein